MTPVTSDQVTAFYGLKWNPFAPDVPVEGLLRSKHLEHFAWRVEQLVGEGGFALITGDCGTGKSAALRLLAGSSRPRTRTPVRRATRSAAPRCT